MTTLPKHDRYPINMINITVSTKCQQIKTYAHIREKNKTKQNLPPSQAQRDICTPLRVTGTFVPF